MKIPLEPDKVYHIYNHVNGKENLFITDSNYWFFLKQYAFFINPIADTFSYCLLPNHFHFAVRVKSPNEIQRRMKADNSKLSETAYISKQFSNLFSSYAQAFNKQEKRMGSLFMPTFKRKLIDSDEYFRAIIHYIHYNPVHHGLSGSIKKWKYSSYRALLSNNETYLKRDEVIAYFDTKENFLQFHQKGIDEDLISDLEK